jgi:hypothetical protein
VGRETILPEPVEMPLDDPFRLQLVKFFASPFPISRDDDFSQHLAGESLRETSRRSLLNKSHVAGLNQV